MDKHSTEAHDRFIEILRATGRENIDYIIEDLESWASSRLRHRHRDITHIRVDFSTIR